MSAERVKCPVCGRDTAVYPNGKIRPHYEAGTEHGCPGATMTLIGYVTPRAKP